MANKERLLELATVIEKGHHKFNGIHAALNMCDWLTQDPYYRDVITEREDVVGSVENCNTAACMAGFACLTFDYKEASASLSRDYFGDYDVEERAQELLGLTCPEARDLFTSGVSKHTTGPTAAKVIREFAETGIIKWPNPYIE